ncbi:leucine Rich Repeat [Seminavis robusta]|uniref:Leucine Rich Repeat n=1 Tax=Seminavis robusta TaxID=568900 RepID=A0A9N8HCR7_9STRA|nr:leucine Rich Repeat [Seminavis robusta]|eukprot:Sro425_g140160.1 leucine Rich Repeat (641) ;mRNA; f:34876-37123
MKEEQVENVEAPAKAADSGKPCCVAREEDVQCTTTHLPPLDEAETMAKRAILANEIPIGGNSKDDEWYPKNTFTNTGSMTPNCNQEKELLIASGAVHLMERDVEEAKEPNAGCGIRQEEAPNSQPMPINDPVVHETNDIAVASPVPEVSELQVARPASARENPDGFFRQKLVASACLLVLQLVIVILVIGVGCRGSGVCGKGSSPDADSLSTSFSHTLRTDFRDHLETILGVGYFDQDEAETSVHRNRALQWILHDDPLQLLPDADNLIQRFVLVLFYFQTFSKQPWLTCGAPTPGQPDLCYYLSPYGNSNERRGTRWLTGTTECFWIGTQCVDGKATRLYLPGNGVNGQIPTELAMLTKLTSLSLVKNDLSGSIPTSMLSLPDLEGLSLSGNLLSGTIPNEVLFSVEALYVGSNLLTGTIHKGVGLFSGDELFLYQNLLTGTLPDDLFGLAQLTALSLFQNGISGNLSPLTGSLSNLRQLHLGHTDIQGSLPSEIGQAASLEYLRLDHSGLSGTIPEELYAASSLNDLVIGDCHFSGTISTLVGLLTNLGTLAVANNRLHGTLPNELFSLSLELLSNLRVNGNLFSGDLPSDVCGGQLGSQMASIAADCTADPDTGVPFMACECCTECCDRQSGNCEVL